MQKYLLGIDIGTSSSKAVIVNTEGKVIAHASLNHSISSPKESFAEHDPDKIWWNEFKGFCKKLLSNSGVSAKEITAIGISGLGPTLVPLDENGKVLRPAILYGIDTRSSNEIEYINRILGEDRIFENSFQILSAQSVGPKILWIRKNEPEIFNKIHKVLTTNGFLVFKLTGKYSVDLTNAAFFGPLFDFRNKKWQTEICRRIDIPVDILPHLYGPVDVVGKVSKEAATETGLNEGTPVICGVVDTFAEAIGAGATDVEDVFLAYGTTMTLVFNTSQQVSHLKLWSNFHYVPGVYTVLGGMATSGILTSWYAENFGKYWYLENSDINKDIKSEDVYNFLSDMADKIEAGSQGLITLPYFSGERTPINDEKARGIIFGLTLSHSGKHIYRSLLEGTGYGVYHHIDILNSINIEPRKIISAGGGTKNRAWVQIISDVTGLPQLVYGIQAPSAPLGNAYMAGFGVGVFDDFNKLKESWLGKPKKIEPDYNNNKKYKEYFKIYKKLYENTKLQMHELEIINNESKLTERS